MLAYIAGLVEEVETSRFRLENAERNLNNVRRSCRHTWSPVKYERFQDPGDALGTMGVDFHGPTWIPRQETKRYSRECGDCGLVEITSSQRGIDVR